MNISTVMSIGGYGPEPAIDKSRFRDIEHR
jgi:hypothetical protein